MGKPYTSIGTFTARTTWGDVEVPITQMISLLGVDGFAVHRQPTRQGFTLKFVVSHVATGLKMPGLPRETSSAAIVRCRYDLGKKRIARPELEKRIEVLSSLDKVPT